MLPSHLGGVLILGGIVVASLVRAAWLRFGPGPKLPPLTRDGVTGPRATQIAALAVASMEGALAMSRAKRSAEPLDQVITQLQAVIRDATGQSSTQSASHAR